jgi:hypothetical protein
MTKKPHKLVPVTMPPDWADEFRRAAKEAGETLSGWLAEAGKKRLPAERRKKLSEPKKRGRQPAEET